jgi:hypothetical protein
MSHWNVAQPYRMDDKRDNYLQLSLAVCRDIWEPEKDWGLEAPLLQLRDQSIQIQRWAAACTYHTFFYLARPTILANTVPLLTCPIFGDVLPTHGGAVQ